MGIAKESISAVRERADIVTEIGSRIELKKAGSNHLGLCPFHGEKSPSFNVSTIKQMYHCFGCGASGDVIEFLMKHDGMLFHEAIKDLGERLGIQIEEDQDEASMRRAQEARRQAITLEEVCEKTSAFFKQALLQTPVASQYAANRGLSSEIIEQYGVGFAPASWKPLANVFADYTTSNLLLEAGLVSDAAPDDNQEGKERRGRIDRFRDRLIFPIRDVRGRCIGFGGRVINPNSPNAPKYLNSPETALFQKHRVLYGLHEARASIMREKMAYVTEGYMDVVMMAQYGVGNAVAAMGTALTEDHIRVLLRFTDRVCFIFDGDKAGIAAAWKSLRTVLPFLQPQHSISFLTLPDGKDPDEFLRLHGKEVFMAAASEAPALTEYLLDSLRKQYAKNGSLQTIEAKTQFSVAAEELAALIPEENPLKGLLLQAIDAAVDRPVRQTNHAPGKVSAADRLRQSLARNYNAQAAISAQGVGAAPEASAGQKRPWLPLEEYLKTLPPKIPGSPSAAFNRGLSSDSAPLKHESKPLWDLLCTAAVIAPEKAVTVVDVLLSLLDEESPEEMTLKMVLQECHSIAPKSDTYPADVLQSAIDLLDNAARLVVRLRIREVKLELKQMHRAGAIDDDEYSAELLDLVRQ